MNYYKHKILLINPLWSFQNYPPLNLVELATYVINAGFKETKILDLNFEIKNKLSNTNVINYSVKKILSKKPDIVAITCNSVQFPFVCELSKALKFEDSKLPVIIGGVMPSLSPAETIKKSKCDYVIRGEGEETLLELINSIVNQAAKKSINGISYILNNEIIHNKDRDLIDINMLPVPKYDLVSKNLKNNNLVWLVASRGCAYKCKFCSGNTIWKYQRRKSVDNIFNQLFILKTKYNIKNFIFGDDCLTLNKKWLLDLCNKIKFLNMNFGCLARIDTIDDEILIALKKAGCKQIYHGIESGNFRVRELLDKKIKNNTNDFIINTVRIELNMGFEITSSFMSGIPFETKKGMTDTYKLAKILQSYGSKIQLWILTPYHGLNLIKDCKKQLVKVDRTRMNLQLDIFDKGQFYLYRDFIKKYDKYNSDNFLFLPKNMTLDEFVNYFHEIRRKLNLENKNIKLSKKEIFILQNIKK